MPPKRVQRSRSRQTTPQSPPKGLTSNQSPQHSHRTTRSRSHDDTTPIPAKNAQKQLAVVDEEIGSDDDIEVAPPNPPSDVDSIQRDLNDNAESESDLDDSSSNGDTQLEALDRDLIIDNLSALHKVANQILALIDAKDGPEIQRALSTPTSTFAKRLQNFILQLHSARQVYGSGSYINIPLIIQKLTNSKDIQPGPFRPDAVLQLANLSILGASLIESEERIIYDSLERMYNTFPEPFGYFHQSDGHPRSTSRLTHEMAALGIAFRTQFFIKNVERSGNKSGSNAHDMLRKVFFDEDEYLIPFEIGDQDILPGSEDMILDQIREIQESLNALTNKRTGAVDWARFKGKYSWHNFLTETFRWISLRSQELRSQIYAQGGVDAISARLEQGDLASYRDPTSTTASEPRSLKTPDSSVILLRAARLKAIQAKQARNDGQYAAEPTNQSQLPPRTSRSRNLSTNSRPVLAEIPQTPDQDRVGEDASHGDNYLDGDDEPLDEIVPDQASPPRPAQNSVVPTQQTLAVLAVAREQKQLANKENADRNRRYVDKHSTARRLDWDESQSTEQRVRRREREDEAVEDDEEDDSFETDPRPAKRPRVQQLQTVSYDDEWRPTEEDDEVEELDNEQGEDITPSAQLHRELQRPIVPSRAAMRPPSSTQPLPQRSSVQNRTAPPPSSAPQRTSATASAQRNNSTRTSAAVNLEAAPEPEEDQEPPSSSMQGYNNINAQAKATVRHRSLIVSNTSHPRAPLRPQVRRPWDEMETTRLFEMIAVHGCQWSRILDADAEDARPALQQRTQVQLKDKARNIKMDFLKASQQLPVGFGPVTVKASDKELLRSLGLPYE